MRALITGASRGIGFAMAQAMASRGDHVIGTVQDGPPPAAFGTWDELDVTDPISVAALSARHPGPLDVLVCNAGVYLDKLHPLETGFPAEMWAKTFAVNVMGVFLSVQQFLPQLRAVPAAKIAIIGSYMGNDTQAPGGSFIYRSSKAAVQNLGRNLATELRPEGIAVGIYHPGWVQTDMGGKAADITAEVSAAGLIDRIDALSVANTGCFESWDGRALPY